MTTSKVLDVALKYGYDSPESFSKAFRKVHGVPPSEARGRGVSLKAFPRISFHLSLKGDKDMDYKIVKKDEFTVVGKSIQVTTKDGENFRRIPKFWEECNEDGTTARLCTIGIDKDLLGVCMDVQYDQEQVTYVIAVEDSSGMLVEGLVSRSIPASTWAVFTSIGPMPGAIQSVWKRIFQEWFPSTGYEHSGGAELEVYPLGDTSAEDYRCEIWVPIVKR